MAWLARSLRDSQPVARFQRRCGLFLVASEVAQGGARQANGSSHLPAAPELRNGGGHAAPAERRPCPPTDCSTCNGGLSKGHPQEYVVKNYFYYYLFRISAAMGQEVFYITFLPFIYWTVNPYVARRLIIVWSVVMYIGQVSKDLLKWPRPYSPPVVKLEKRTSAEYGMPSTHAMAATAISFTFVAATVNQYKYPFELGLMGAFLFSTLVGLSRIYTGMHTVLNIVPEYFYKFLSYPQRISKESQSRNSYTIRLTYSRIAESQPSGARNGCDSAILLYDVIVGSLISGLLIAITFPTWDFLDHLMLTSAWCPILCIVVPLLLCYNYPKLDYYSPTRADTTTILGAGAGATIGFWMNHHYITNISAEIVSPTSAMAEMLLMMLAKFLVGICLLVVTRQIVKSMALRALCSWYKVSVGDLVARQQAEIEVPYKFITYSFIGLSATVLVPLLHEILGLN